MIEYLDRQFIWKILKNKYVKKKSIFFNPIDKYYNFI